METNSIVNPDAVRHGIAIALKGLIYSSAMAKKNISDEDPQIVFTPIVSPDEKLMYMAVDIVSVGEKPKYHQVLLDPKDVKKIVKALNFYL
jgi:hypothetical protein